MAAAFDNSMLHVPQCTHAPPWLPQGMDATLICDSTALPLNAAC